VTSLLVPRSVTDRVDLQSGWITSDDQRAPFESGGDHFRLEIGGLPDNRICSGVTRTTNR
jgi:hypothetical protein